MSTQSEILARHYVGLEIAHIPQDVLQEAKRLLLDTLASMYAASGTEIGPVAFGTGRLFGASGQAPSAAAAAYAYGRLADAMDFSEGYAGAHFGSAAVAAAMAAAREGPVSGAGLLAAICAGFDLGARVMDAIGPYYTKAEDGEERFSSVWGIATPVVYASVAAAAKVLRLDVPTTEQAYGLAGSSSPIPIGAKWAVERDLPNTKYCDAGWGALTGLVAALSARLGSTGLTSLLDGPDGLYRMVSALHPRAEALTAGLGEDWGMRRILYKRWPCCGLIAGPMRNLENLQRRHRLDAARIEAIVAEVVPAVLLPRFINPEPATYTSLQFSLPHNLSMLLLGIPVGAAWLSGDWLGHEQARCLRRKVMVRRYREAPDARPAAAQGGRPSAIRIRIDGAELIDATPRESAPVRIAWSDQDIIAKFRSQVLTQHAQPLIDAVMGLESLPEAGPFIAAVDRLMLRDGALGFAASMGTARPGPDDTRCGGSGRARSADTQAPEAQRIY